MKTELKKIKPVVVCSLNDIKRIIDEFQRKPSDGQKVQIKLDGQQVEAVVNNSDSYMDLLITGLDEIKAKMEIQNKEFDPVVVNGVQLTPLSPVPNTIKTWVDDFIKTQMGGFREDLRVVWQVKEGVFKFDPYQIKLVKVEE